jgi:hypothetical protein
MRRQLGRRHPDLDDPEPTDDVLQQVDAALAPIDVDCALFPAPFCPCLFGHILARTSVRRLDLLHGSCQLSPLASGIDLPVRGWTDCEPGLPSFPTSAVGYGPVSHEELRCGQTDRPLQAPGQVGRPP